MGGGNNAELGIMTFRNRFLSLVASLWGRIHPGLRELRKWLDANLEPAAGPFQGILLCEVQLYSVWSPFYLSIIAQLAGRKVGASTAGSTLVSPDKNFSKYPVEVVWQDERPNQNVSINDFKSFWNSKFGIRKRG